MDKPVVMYMEYPRKKPNRLPDYDYSQNGAYFITICTKDRKHLLSRIAVGTSIARPPAVQLTRIGKLAETAILAIPDRYPGVFVDHYVIMPNHVHLILRLDAESGRPMVVPTVGRILQQMKGWVTKQANQPVWQSRYYDHVIRDDYDYLIKYQYIDENPENWLLRKDEYA